MVNPRIEACRQYLQRLGIFESDASLKFEVTEASTVAAFLKRRDPFSHKGNYGTGGLIVGSKGMMGAAALCATAFMRSGAGKVTCHVPELGYDILQTSVPEAMVKIEHGMDHIESVSSLDKYDVLGIGPGIGPYASHLRLLQEVLTDFRKPVVIDADGLNALARNKALLKELPTGSVLTPHVGEFERLFGPSPDDGARVRLALEQAKKFSIVIVLKGAFTLVASSAPKAWFNTSGNPGMATGGAGDVLTGVIAGLLAQGYAPLQAALLGVYVHGLAGDLAVAETSQEALIASDLCRYLGKGWLSLHALR